MNNLTITVSQLNRYVKARLEEDYRLKEIFIRGEISNLADHYRSGHIYFSLKDEAASVKAVMFRQNAQNLRFPLSDGMRVIVRCGVSLYERDGSFQIYVRETFPDGVGERYLSFLALRDKLEKEGLFDPALKRALPRYPGKVGVVTSPSGAALQDILHILGRRWPLCRVVLSPATVQGEGAADSIRQALVSLYPLGCDVIIIGRGGGSAEDLWAFNDEELAREVRRCPVPVVSAVGHETDYTILDFVSDLRAPTPSAAAELAAPDIEDIRFYLERLQDQLYERIGAAVRRGDQMTAALRSRIEAASPAARFDQARKRLAALRGRVESVSPGVRLAVLRAQVEEARRRIDSSLHQQQCYRRERVEDLRQWIDSLSPLRTLERGYGIPLREKKAVHSVRDLRVGECFSLLLPDGEADARVLEIREKEAPGFGEEQDGK